MSRQYRRDDAAPFEFLQARVNPATKAGIFAAAKRSGISVSLYLDLLAQQLRNADGALPKLTRPQCSKGELPIDMAA